MRRREDRIGLKSAWLRTVIPYSVSIPITFGRAIPSSLRPVSPVLPRASRRRGDRGRQKGGEGAPAAPPPRHLQVLTGSLALHGPLLVLALTRERLDVDDPLALLPGDLRPVVGVGRVRQILVLLELLAHRRQQVVQLDALFDVRDVSLERELLGATHDRFHH